MTGKALQGEFIIERELSQPIKQGDLRIFKAYCNDDFQAPKTESYLTFLHPATTMLLDVRSVSINKWNTLASQRKKEIKDSAIGDCLSMSGTDYVSDSIFLVHYEKIDIELKSIPMQYIIKRIDGSHNEVILTYDVPEFPGGSLFVPAPTSTITNLVMHLPKWDFRDLSGGYVPEGEYEISLNVPDTVEYKELI